MRHPRATIALSCGALALAALVSGCGGEKTVEAPGHTVRIAIDEYRLVPQKIRVSGPHITIAVTDKGRLTHNIKVFSTTQVDTQDKPILLGGTPTAHPGETVRGDITLPPGRYRIACTIANHDDLGEHGILIVSGRSRRGGGES